MRDEVLIAVSRKQAAQLLNLPVAALDGLIRSGLLVTVRRGAGAQRARFVPVSELRLAAPIVRRPRKKKG